MQEIARRSQAACHSFFTVRRATCVCALRSTALVFTRTCFTQSRFRGMRRWGFPNRARVCPATRDSGGLQSRDGSCVLLTPLLHCTAEGQPAAVFCYSFVPRRSRLMPRNVRCALIQTSNALSPDRPLAQIRKAMIDKHLKLIEQAALKKTQILCLQELFYGPYF